jgi:hypothetical protein
MNLKKTHFDRHFEFQFPDVDTRILVEDLKDGVIIRASCDTFSERRKLRFVRELAAEGFIADCFQWSCRGVRWLVDESFHDSAFRVFSAAVVGYDGDVVSSDGPPRMTR